MEHPLCAQRQKPQNPLSSSPTADTLDLPRLLASDRIQPLISESITFDTLSSSSSDQVAPFSTCKPPRLSIIGLGDHLKMFSGPLSQLQDGVKPKIVITSPTSPRLKSMFKECLCISKWAECLNGWRAPGHIPWGNLSDQNTDDEKWLPEGSLYSPEDFSRALNQARAGYMRVNVAQTEQEPCAILDSALDKHTNDFGSSSETLTRVDLLDMMRELKDLKNFFEGTPQVSEIVHPEQVILPSLMISNSHCTFPLSLDSCQSFTIKPATNLADRRGMKPPPPLLLKKEIQCHELPYPDIPTAFLGSPSSYSPEFRDVDFANTSGLRIEEMINNLRLQCSSMVPPVDVSWNSQSCSVAYEPANKSTEAGSTAFPAKNGSSGLVTLAIPTGPQKGTSLSGVKVANPHKIGTATKKLQTAKFARTNTPDKKAGVLSKYTSPPLLLRSSLAKHRTFRPRSNLKSVRFALSPSEFEKDIASLMYDDVWRSSRVSSTQDHLYDQHSSPTSNKEDLEERTRLIRENTKSWHPTSSGIKTKERIKSIVTKPSLGHPIVPNIFYGNTNKDTQQSLESRGRHSLSRIIKGPIFSGKRSTVSTTISARWEKGSTTRDAESIQRKSRMPVPLRNILTHFK